MRVFVAAVVAALALGCAGQARAQTRWDLPTPLPEGSLHTRNVQDFVKDVAARSNNTLRITVHPNQSLIRAADIKDGIRRGAVPIGEILLARHEGQYPALGLETIPLVAGGYDAQGKFYQVLKPFLQKLFEREGMVLLFSVPAPGQGLFANRELNGPEDLAGLKVRAQSRWRDRFVQLLGATVVPVEPNDFANALKTGAIDAVLATASTGADMKLWETLKIFYDLQAVFSRDAVLVNKAAFDALTENERKALVEAGNIAEGRGWDMSRNETKEKTELLAKNGVRVVQPGEGLRAALVTASRATLAEWQQAVGDDARALYEAYSKK